MATLTLQQVSKLLSKQAITKLNPASAVASTGIQAGKQVSKEIFGYDFVGLILKLVVFYGVALIIAKVMEAIIFARGAFVILANTLGYNVPNSDQLPQSLKDLFGGKGLKVLSFGI